VLRGGKVSEELIKINVLKRTEKEIEIEVEGEDHTLGNLVAKMALRHPNVSIAFYTIDHPLVGKLRIRIVSDGSKDVGEVFNEVLESIKKDVSELMKVVQEKLK